ncbi:hypothetical protein SVIOM342S_03263 [Streptomyces violaceorubidus]
MTVDALTDVAGLLVGHATRAGDGWLTGTTVVLAPEGGAVAGVDVRGGGPGTKETDALDPRNLVQKVQAVVLTGGSAYGLDAASGVMAWLEERGRGVRVGPDPATVDVNTQTMTVVRDGKTLKLSVPISAGSASNPTYNGQMVISEKSEQTRMNGSTVGFGGEYDTSRTCPTRCG